MSNPVILDAKEHKMYDDRVGADKYHTADDKKGGNFTLHHIIPYRYPYFIGFLFDAIARSGAFDDIGGKDEDPRIRTLLIDMKLICNAILPKAAKFTGADLTDPAKSATLGHKFAWMGVNLFVGPTSSVRVDDPGSNPEPICPTTFDAEHWDRIKGLKSLIDNFIISFSDKEAGGCKINTIKINLCDGHIFSLIRHLKLLMCYGADAHEYKNTDWMILDPSDREDPSYKTQQKKEVRHGVTGAVIKSTTKTLTASTISEFKELYKSAPDMFMKFRPMEHRDVDRFGSVAPQYIVLWRLRLPGEKIPEHGMMGNFIMQ